MAALAVLDATLRLIPGVLNDERSAWRRLVSYRLIWSFGL